MTSTTSRSSPDWWHNHFAMEIVPERGPRCPHCWGKYTYDLTRSSHESGRRYLHPEKVNNPLSRLTGEYICSDCGRAEALGNFFRWIPDMYGMARTAVYNDREEGRRLPAGFPMAGGTGFVATGELVTQPWVPDPLADHCWRCGGLWLDHDGVTCRECGSNRNDDPYLVE